jgi:hypothetical protein
MTLLLDINWDDNFPIVLLVSMKIFCFLIGYLTIRLGYKLIESGVKGEFKFSANYHGIKGGLVSSSPGLLFVLLGVGLICYAMYVNKTYDHKVEEQVPTKSLYHPIQSNDYDPIP